MNARMAAILSAVLFSTGGAAIKSTAMNSWQVASIRSAIAGMTVALLIPSARKNWTLPAALVAVAYALCLTTFVHATKNTTSANAIFLQGTAPLYLVLLGPWLLKERVRLADWLTMLLVGFGMLLVFRDQPSAQALSPNPALGNLLGAASGACWAATVCGLRWLSKRRDTNAMTPVLMGNCLAALITLPNALPFAAISQSDWISLFYLGIVQIGLAYWCLTRAMHHLNALEASLIIMIEPALNPVWTWLFHGERPGNTAILGGALIIAAALAKSWQDRKNVLT
jgi:drug/metabolite transporter, DME family